MSIITFFPYYNLKLTIYFKTKICSGSLAACGGSLLFKTFCSLRSLRSLRSLTLAYVAPRLHSGPLCWAPSACRGQPVGLFFFERGDNSLLPPLAATKHFCSFLTFLQKKSKTLDFCVDICYTLCIIIKIKTMLKLSKFLLNLAYRFHVWAMRAKDNRQIRRATIRSLRHKHIAGY